MNDLILRKAEDRDAPAIARLLIIIARLHHGLRPDVFSDAGPKYDETAVREMLRDENQHIAVAERDGTALGYAIAQVKSLGDGGLIVSRRIYYIDDLCVDETARGQGIGKALVAYCRKEAKALGCDAVELNVWTANRGAAAFYEKCGFAVQRQTMEIAPDA